ncbi:uncharacterized protein LOC133911327 [Phragmites australis]|uniref:uncharacterized protein LOC133911327 n=1 Tax=Phragmites australis TaxID=29695 RepID=UPI002D773136|nr:uncharacterized protein LOC133911327 [Phragmites australis]
MPPLAPPRLLVVVARPVSARPQPMSLRVVRCMAKERRMRMVTKQIQRELAEMLTRDPILQHAVLPEAALGADRYLSSLTTIAAASPRCPPPHAVPQHGLRCRSRRFGASFITRPGDEQPWIGRRRPIAAGGLARLLHQGVSLGQSGQP